jgi:hypothetical protein
LDPDWRPPQSVWESIEGQIRHHEATAEQAEARLAEILRDAIPGTNPSWGVNRLRKELNDRGYFFKQQTRDPGYLYENPQTGEQVRIMERPRSGPHRTESRQKFHNEYYYRYRRGGDQGWGALITVPNK